MKHILKYIFSLFLVVFSFNGNAQNVKKSDTIAPKKEQYGIRVGIDLFKLTRSLYEKDYRGIELVGDYKLTRKHYIAAEIGNENKTVIEDHLNFTTSGTYIKAGFDYNAYENWLGMQNMIYLGARYGVSSFSHTLNSYQVYNSNQYFGTSPVVFPDEKFNGLSAQWIEVLAGIKAEVLNNLYVGFSFRLNNLVSNKKPDTFDNLYIPGFNRTYNGNFGAGFNYTISYFVPLYKSTVKTKAVKSKKIN